MDPQFPGDISLVYRSVRELRQVWAANAVAPKDIKPRADRKKEAVAAAAAIKQRALAEAAGSPPIKPTRSAETGTTPDGGTVPDPRMAGKWKEQGCVKSDRYRAAWKEATRRYAEEREKSLRPGAVAGRDWLGAGRIAAETRVAHDGCGPCAQTILDAVKYGHESPAKPGPEGDMPNEVEEYLEDVVEQFNLSHLPVFRETVIENAKLLITGTCYEDAFAAKMNALLDKVDEWDEVKVRARSVACALAMVVVRVISPRCCCCSCGDGTKEASSPAPR